MSKVYVTSDWHLGHRGISNKFRPQFSSDEEHDLSIVHSAASIVKKKDLLFCLGDMAFDEKSLALMDEVKCRKILVRGNHDEAPTVSYLRYFDEVHGAMYYKNCFLTHIPIHPMELYRGYNIHGHCHSGGPGDLGETPHSGSYYNAILEFNDYLPADMADVLKKLKGGADG